MTNPTRALLLAGLAAVVFVAARGNGLANPFDREDQPVVQKAIDSEWENGGVEEWTEALRRTFSRVGSSVRSVVAAVAAVIGAIVTAVVAVVRAVALAMLTVVVLVVQWLLHLALSG